MSGDLTIRFVTRQDYAQWLPLWDGYNAFYGRSGATALAPEITAMTWARFFDAYEPVHALVAESGGALISEVYEAARQAGTSRVYWQTHETNRTAQALYDKVAERSGFIVYRKLF